MEQNKLTNTNPMSFEPKKSIAARYSTPGVYSSSYYQFEGYDKNNITPLDKVLYAIKKEIGLEISIAERYIHELLELEANLKLGDFKNPESSSTWFSNVK